MNIHKITTKVTFPEGLAPGEGSLSNKKTVAKNGKDQTILRGSSLAGVLRSAYSKNKNLKSNSEEINGWFGDGSTDDSDSSSIVKVSDAIIESSAIKERTHNMINRHTGAAVHGALYSMETIPPMATSVLSISINIPENNKKNIDVFVEELCAVLGNNLLVGGSSNRGIGRMVVDKIFLNKYNLDSLDSYADWLDMEYKERINGISLKGKEIKIQKVSKDLSITLELGIPRGEDFLVGDGQETDYALQPQTTIFKDGSKHWQIPGSSMRGIIRGWMTRLAAIAKEEVRDSLEIYEKQYAEENAELYKADLSAWGFELEQKRDRFKKDPSLLKDPILDLFGSMYKKGRIHISDAYSVDLAKELDRKDRMHVAIDTFSGGANEGALFNNLVLTSSKLKFPLTITLESPKEKELKWLIKTLRAVHLGILAIGSSKSSGRLEIKSISAEGELSSLINDFSKEIK